MLKHDNLQWHISLTLCLLCTNGVIGSVIKPDILEALGEIAGYDLTAGDMRRYHIWPQGIIPYYIDDFSFDKVLRDKIRSNLDQMGKVTGLNFMEIPQPPTDDDSRWVFFLNRKARLGCDDVAYKNFTSDGVQKVVLGYDCMKSEDIAEIILSLVGVAPQHNSPDRDDYITVNMENILPDKQYLFKKMKPEDWMFNKLDYDFDSAGHYNTHKYTKNGAETISPKNQENYIQGSKGLSAMDIKKIRTTYNYISYKGKNQVNVPECSKLFVTGSNFRNYKPATKSDKRLKMPLPNHSSPLSSENTTNIISKEVNSNESSKLKDDIHEESDEKPNDSKDKTEDEADTEHLNPETSKDTKIDSGPNSDNESQQQSTPPGKLKLNNEKNSQLEKKLSLLKVSGDDEGEENDPSERKKKLLTYTEKKADIKQNSGKFQLKKEKNFDLEKKLALLKVSGEDEGEENDPSERKKKLLKYTGKKADIKHNSGKFQLNKEKNSDLEKKLALLKVSGEDKGEENDPSERKKKLLKYTGKKADIKHNSGKFQLKKEKNFDLEKKLALLKVSGEDEGEENDPSERKKKLLKYTGKKADIKHNSGKFQLNKEKNSDLEKKLALLKVSGEDKGEENDPSERKKKLLKYTGKKADIKHNSGKFQLKKEKKFILEKKMSLLKVNGEDEKEKNYLLNKKRILLKKTEKKPVKKPSNDAILLKSDYSTGDEEKNNYLNDRKKIHFN